MARPLPPSDENPGMSVQQSTASFNSVSTRIIACVFAATVLSTAIVSGLCIRAIHSDLAARLVGDFSILADDRAEAWSARRAELAALVTAESAVGSPWQAALARARADVDARTALGWHSADAPNADALALETLIAGELPPPPPALAERFEVFFFGHPDALARSADGCISIEADVPAESGATLGRLLGCVAREELVALLQPEPGLPVSTRVLVANLHGTVLAAAGPGAPTRLADTIPIPDLIRRGSRSLSDYSDTAGRALVGLAIPLGRTGWFLAIETEHARAFAHAIEVTRTIFIAAIVVVTLFSLLAYKITAAIMQPIHALSSGAQRILDGHIDHQIPLPAIRDDELGLLTRTFNAMMQKLRSNQIEIERDRVRLAEKNEELQSANEVLNQLSITDGLTKLHNHRYFQDHLTREIKRVSRTNAPLSLILVDIDDFKQLNDTYGHAAGDEVLISLASIMNENARESDLIARYGGEEFVILMPNTDLAGAVHLAEKIRMAVESTRLIIGDRMKPTDVTISLGVALYKGNRREFFAEADRALYRAKGAGKNCVIIAGSDDTPALS